MSKLLWPAEGGREVLLSTKGACCEACGAPGQAVDVRRRKLRSLQGSIVLRVLVRRCATASCVRFRQRVGGEAEFAIAPPTWSLTWEMFAWIGYQRFGRDESVPKIRTELADRFALHVSNDWVEDVVHRYQSVLAARESDLSVLRAAYAEVADVVLTIDGLQPEKGHETLYVVRDARTGRIWFAQALLSSAAAEVRSLFERAKEMAQALGKPVRGWMSDKQKAFVTSAAEVFPGVPHRYCNNHFLRDLAKPILEIDSHAKVQMRRKVRGLREIEKTLLAEAPAKTAGTTNAARAEPQAPLTQTPPPQSEALPTAPSGEATPTTPSAAPPTGTQVPADQAAPGQGGAETTRTAVERGAVLDLCAAVRGVLNDDQGGPLTPPGVRMDAALADIEASLNRVLEPKKGGPRQVRHRRLASPIS